MLVDYHVNVFYALPDRQLHGRKSRGAVPLGRYFIKAGRNAGEPAAYGESATACHRLYIFMLPPGGVLPEGHVRVRYPGPARVEHINFDVRGSFRRLGGGK